MAAESKYTEFEFYTHTNTLLLQDIVQLRYVKNRGEQERILRACHINPPASHMGVKRTLRRMAHQWEIHVVWTGQGCRAAGLYHYTLLLVQSRNVTSNLLQHCACMETSLLTNMLLYVYLYTHKYTCGRIYIFAISLGIKVWHMSARQQETCHYCTWASS